LSAVKHVRSTDSQTAGYPRLAWSRDRMELRAENVVAGYGRRAVLHGVSLSVTGGSFVGLVGPNGSGKSTVLRVLAGTLALWEGRVLLGDTSIGRLSRGQVARSIAVVPQSPPLPDTFTALEIVLMGRSPHLRLLESEGEHDYAIAWEALARSQATHLADRPVGELSGGECQMVVVARAIAQRPAVMLLDEPTSHLDLRHQTQAMEVVRGMCDEGLGALGVFHDVNLAAQYCDEICLMDQGVIVARGAPEDVLTDANVLSVYGQGLSVVSHPRNSRPVVLVSRRNPPAAPD
jgi:iron complex transport system ATP-binding protein